MKSEEVIYDFCDGDYGTKWMSLLFSLRAIEISIMMGGNTCLQKSREFTTTGGSIAIPSVHALMSALKVCRLIR